MILQPLSKPIQALEDVEMKYILRALASCDWNRTLCAEKLKISIRLVRIRVAQARRKGFIVPDNRDCRECEDLS